MIFRLTIFMMKIVLLQENLQHLIFLKMKGVYDFLDFANKWECFFNDMEDLQEKYVIKDENGNRKFTSKGKLALAEKTEDFIDVIDTIIGKLPGSSYYSSLLDALPKYM